MDQFIDDVINDKDQLIFQTGNAGMIQRFAGIIKQFFGLMSD